MNECSFVYHHHNLMYMSRILTSHSNRRQLKHYHNSYIKKEEYSEHRQISRMERFAKMVSSWLLTIFTKSSILDVSQGSEYASVTLY